jgi:hypothetical protein
MIRSQRPMERAAVMFTLLTVAAPAFALAQESKTGFLGRSVRVGEVDHAYKV